MEQSEVEEMNQQPSVLPERRKPCICCRIPRRYIVTLLIGLVMLITTWSFYNLHITIIFNLVKKSKMEGSQFNEEDLNMIFLAFFWAGAAGQIPGALLAMAFSAHRMLFISLISSSLICMAIPYASSLSTSLLVFVIVLLGLFQGPVYPCVIGMFVNWAPPAEKTRLYTIMLTGFHMGSLFGIQFSDHIQQTLGEDICFYVVGISGLVWAFLWKFLAYHSPTSDPFITDKELTYLKENINSGVNKLFKLRSLPVKAILTSVPVWVISLIALLYGVCFFSVPTAMFYFGGPRNQALLYLPIILLPPSGYLSDYLINKGLLSTGATRKVFCSGAFVIFGSLSLAVAFCQCPSAGLIIHDVAYSFLTLTVAGYGVNCLDIGGKYAVLVEGISRTFKVLGIAFCAFITDKLVFQHTDREYHIAFYIEGAAALLAAFIFGFFASGETQAWAKSDRNEEEDSSTHRLGSEYYPRNEDKNNDVLAAESTSL